MNVLLKNCVRLFGCFAIAACAANVKADDPVTPATPVAPRTDAATQKHMSSNHVMRASQIEKMNVRNNAGDKIGAIEDLVVNTETGQVAYAALGFGGFLGMGEKLFAVPWNDMHFRNANNETFILLNVTKEELKNAPGFDKDHWPNFADPNFTKEIDKYYQEHRTNDHPKVGLR